MEALIHADRAFEKVVAAGQAFPGRTFEQCTFTRCDLARADFAKSKFIDCTFTGCDLSMVKLRGVSVQNVVFKECKLLGVDFSVCSEMLFGVRFDNCALDHSVFVDRKMSKTRFSKCSLKGVDLTGADLNEAVFADCDLLDAVFERTQLRKADLTSAQNFHIDPEKNPLKGARFSVDGALSLLGRYGVVVE
ncbi:MAG: pentapeptide repeat-containing protein [Flavobacteriales bacterium]